MTDPFPNTLASPKIRITDDTTHSMQMSAAATPTPKHTPSTEYGAYTVLEKTGRVKSARWDTLLSNGQDGKVPYRYHIMELMQKHFTHPENKALRLTHHDNGGSLNDGKVLGVDIRFGFHHDSYRNNFVLERTGHRSLPMDVCEDICDAFLAAMGPELVKDGAVDCLDLSVVQTNSSPHQKGGNLTLFLRGGGDLMYVAYVCTDLSITLQKLADIVMTTHEKTTPSEKALRTTVTVPNRVEITRYGSYKSCAEYDQSEFGKSLAEIKIELDDAIAFRFD